jgi:hypothetical protein
MFRSNLKTHELFSFHHATCLGAGSPKEPFSRYIIPFILKCALTGCNLQPVLGRELQGYGGLEPEISVLVSKN